MLMPYLTRHMQASIYSFGKLTRMPLASFMTCFIIGIALALPVLLFVTLKNAETISNSFQQTLQMTLYLKPAITRAQALNLAETLQKQRGIQTVRTISPAEGLKELQQQAGFDKALENLPNNPLPWVIVVAPVEQLKPAALEKLEQHLKLLPQIENVQLDILWAKRLASWMTLAHRITYALAVFLGLAVLLIVHNTIRSATEQHRKEIEVIKLIGGTNAFIRRPFLYAGMGHGLLGGIAAWLLVALLIWLLQGPSQQLADLYGSTFILNGLGLGDGLILLFCSILLGLMGSWVAVRAHLNCHSRV